MTSISPYLADLISTSPSESTSDSMLLPLILALSILLTGFTLAITQTCTRDDEDKPLRISIPPHIESPPTTPSPPPQRTSPPPAPARIRKLPRSFEDDLDSKILRFLRFNPGSTVKDMLHTFKTSDPSLTKSEMNSHLYSMLRSSVVKKEGDIGAPNWFIN